MWDLICKKMEKAIGNFKRDRKQLRARWVNNLSSNKKNEWSLEEDINILEAF